MLAAIKHLQVITHLCLMSVIIPANAQIYFGYIFTVIAFDPIEIQDQVENFFNLEQSDDFELEDKFV